MKNWSDYPIFLAVAEVGSLTAAGKKLGMSQPTVGRRIRALEDHFKTPLLKREDGILIPTRFGQSMLEHIQRMQDEAAAIDRSSATLEDSLSGVVRLSATEGIGTAWLPGVMQIFRDEHPDILIDLGIGFRDFNLAQREADIAIMDGKQLWLRDGNEMIHHPHRITFQTNGIGMQALPGGQGPRHQILERVLPDVVATEDLYLVAHQDLRRSTRIRAVYDFLVKAFKKDQNFFLEGDVSTFRSGSGKPTRLLDAAE